MSKDQKNVCLYCKWWCGNTTVDLMALYGDCREDAPSLDAEGCGIWPTTGADDWCGKFTERRDDHPSTWIPVGEAANSVIAGLEAETAP